MTPRIMHMCGFMYSSQQHRETCYYNISPWSKLLFKDVKRPAFPNPHSQYWVWPSRCLDSSPSQTVPQFFQNGLSSHITAYITSLTFDENSELVSNNSVGDRLEEEETWAAVTEGIASHTLPLAWLPLCPEVTDNTLICLSFTYLMILGLNSGPSTCQVSIILLPFVTRSLFYFEMRVSLNCPGRPLIPGLPVSISRIWIKFLKGKPGSPPGANTWHCLLDVYVYLELPGHLGLNRSDIGFSIFPN